MVTGTIEYCKKSKKMMKVLVVEEGDNIGGDLDKKNPRLGYHIKL